MKINQTISKNRMELSVEGRLDALTAPEFEAEISAQLEGITELDIDLGALEYISSAGLRALLYLQQTMDEKKGTLTVRRVPEVIMSIFELTGFDDIIRIV